VARSFDVAGQFFIAFLVPVMCFLLAGLVLFPDTVWHQQAGANTVVYPELAEQIVPFLFGRIASLDVPGLTDEEASHLADVGVLVRAGVFLLMAGIVLVVLLLQICTQAKRAVIVGACLTVVIPALLAIVPFQTVFSTFHVILFPAGNYTFPASFILIQTYSSQFWQTGSVAFSLIASNIASLVAIAVLQQK